MVVTDWHNLLIEARKGSEAAFQAVYDELAEPLFRFSLARTKDQALAEDITQETLVRLYENLNSLSLSCNSLLPWCYTVAKRLIIDHSRRKHSAVLSIDELFEVGDGVNQEEKANERFLFNQLVTELSNLSDDEYQAIWLKYIDGFNNQEIADQLNKTEVAIRKLQSRGLAKLRNNLSQ